MDPHERLRQLVYQHFVDTSRAPTMVELATSLSCEAAIVRRRLAQLHEQHVLVIDPATSEIRMAMPFSAEPTTYRVHSGSRSWWAN